MGRDSTSCQVHVVVVAVGVAGGVNVTSVG